MHGIGRYVKMLDSQAVLRPDRLYGTRQQDVKVGLAGGGKVGEMGRLRFAKAKGSTPADLGGPQCAGGEVKSGQLGVDSGRLRTILPPRAGLIG